MWDTSHLKQFSFQVYSSRTLAVISRWANDEEAGEGG